MGGRLTTTACDLEALAPRDGRLTKRQRRYDIVSHSSEETLEFGRKLAVLAQPPCLVLMEGELGSGKTVLTKGIVSGLDAAPETEVTSPTFALVHEYVGERKVYHLDLYRVEGERDLATLGLDEMLDQDATVIVEWGEKLRAYALFPHLEVRLQHRGERERRILVDEITGN